MPKFVAVKVRTAPGKPYDKTEDVGVGAVMFGEYASMGNFIKFRVSRYGEIGREYNIYTHTHWKNHSWPHITYLVKDNPKHYSHAND